jgi:hypothetical protein
VIQCCAHGLRFDLASGYLLNPPRSRSPATRSNITKGRCTSCSAKSPRHDRRRHHQRQPPHPRTGTGFLVSLIVAAPRRFLRALPGPRDAVCPAAGHGELLAGDGRCKAGIEFTARTVLRLGVALLGMRITLEIASLGWKPVVLVVTLVVVTILVSVLAAGPWAFQRLFGLLTGGATAICGASAALAWRRRCRRTSTRSGPRCSP